MENNQKVFIAPWNHVEYVISVQERETGYQVLVSLKNIFITSFWFYYCVEKVVRNFQNCVLYQPTLSSHLGEFQWFRLKRFSALYLINLQRHYQSVFSISKTIFEHFLREQCRFYKSFSKHIEVTGAIEGKKKIN